MTLDTKQLSGRLRQRLSEPAMLELTKRWIAIPSKNPPGNQYEECALLLVDELNKLGFDDVRREGACILASAGSGSRTLYFSGHYDVVPAQSQDQFQPRVEGANLFGRGSSDMKSGLAAMIHATAAARDEGLLSDGRIITIDRRLNPEENLEEENRRLLDALEGFEIEVLQEEPAAATPAGDRLGVILSGHIGSANGKEPAFEMCPGLLETRFYAARGIPAFAYGPELLTVSHGPTEFVPMRNIAQCALIYALTAAEILSQDCLAAISASPRGKSSTRVGPSGYGCKQCSNRLTGFHLDEGSLHLHTRWGFWWKRTSRPR